MIPPTLDVTSELFDASEALRSNNIRLPYPKVKTYNNIAEYYSHTFLKKGLKLIKSSKDAEKPRARDYEWYYDTLGLSEYQKNINRSTKKTKFRKGKKPVSVVTIPGSPLRSGKVTVCKSDFKDYCRRKYCFVNTASATMDSKSIECNTFPSNNFNESSFSTVTHMEPLNSTSSSQFIKLEALEQSPSFSSTETDCAFTSHSTIKFDPSKKSSSPHYINELPSTSSVSKAELSDSSDDSFTDDILIYKMKSNLRNVRPLRKVHKSPDSFQRKTEHWKLSSKSKHIDVNSKNVQNSNQVSHPKKFETVSKHDSSPNDQTINFNLKMKSNIALNDPGNEQSSDVKDSKVSISNQKKDSKKHKICSKDKLNLQKNPKTTKLKRKQKCQKNNDNPNDLNVDPQKSATQDISSQNTSALCKENSVNESKSNIQNVKKRKKSALKSQENVLDFKKVSTEIKTVNKSESKIKTETSTSGSCTCKFPCGLAHLCTCGYFASAKEVLSKFKIPRKKK